MLALHKGQSRFAGLTGYVLEVPANKSSELWFTAFLARSIGGYLASKLTNWWVSRTGGKHLRAWATRRKLLHPFRTALLSFLAGSACIVGFYRSVPLWADLMDASSVSYGNIAVRAWLSSNRGPETTGVDSRSSTNRDHADGQIATPRRRQRPARL